MEQTIRTQICHVFRTFWFSLALIEALAVIFGAIAVAGKSPILGTVGVMMAIFLPIIFMSKIKALYSKEATFIGILLVVAVVVMFATKGASAGFLLIGLGAYLPLLAKRRSDLALYRKMSELDSVE